MPMQLFPVGSPILQRLDNIGARFYGPQTLTGCELHPNGTASCADACVRGFGRRYVVRGVIICMPFAAAKAPIRPTCTRAINGMLLKLRRTFYDSESVVVPGVINAQCSTSDLFDNAYNNEADIAFQFYLRGPAPGAQSDIFIDPGTSRMSITPSKMMTSSSPSY